MKKNVAGQKIGAQLVSATDGSAFTGAVTVEVTVDAGTQATGTVGSGACTHEGNGYHTYAPSQAETNGDLVAFTFHGTGAVPVTIQVYTNFPQTGDSFARIGAPVGASISADVAGVQSDTDNIQTRLPAALVGGRMDSSVGSIAAGIGHETLPPELRKYNVLLVTTSTAVRKSLTKVAGGAAGSGDWTPAAGDVKLSKDGGAEANITNLPTFVNGRWEFILTATELTCKLLTVRIADQGTKVILDADFEVFTFGNASAWFPDDMQTAAPTDSSIADAVWEEALADHEGTAGSTAEALATAGGSGASAADIADAVWDEATAGHATAGTFGKAAADTLAAVDTEIAAIKAKTDNLPSDPADASDISSAFTSLNAKVDTIDDFLDTEIAAIKAKTDQLTFTVSNQLDANVQAVNDVALTGDGDGTPWGPV